MVSPSWCGLPAFLSSLQNLCASPQKDDGVRVAEQHVWAPRCPG